MARIETLAEDLRGAIGSADGKRLAKEASLHVGAYVAKKVERALTREDRPRRPNVLFPSELGHPCKRKIWYEFHYDPATMQPKEEISGKARIKFLYGDIIEAMIVPLISIAGHDVTDVGKKIKLELPRSPGWTLEGAMDLKVDGTVVDIKSMNARSFDNWAKDPNTADKFGYAHQIWSYWWADGGDTPWILGINKEDGAVGQYQLKSVDVLLAAEAKYVQANRLDPDKERMPTVSHGARNTSLGTVCSYCPYKRECWKDSNGGKGLRTFIYSTGPKFLTEVVDEPRVLEVPV